MTIPVSSMTHIDSWPVRSAAAAVVENTGRVLASHGDGEQVFPLASVSKLLTAYTVLVAIEEGAFELDDPAGPAGATVRHLLAHTSGLAFDTPTVVSAVGAKRTYSNVGFDTLTKALAERTDIDFASYLQEALLDPLNMRHTTLVGSPAAGISSTANDLARFAAELQRPTLLSAHMMHSATQVAFSGVDGVLPGYGLQRPNDWGLGFELRDHKNPHWTGANNSSATFGHFGQSGTFLWVDPKVGLACVCLTDETFGPWAVQSWPEFSDAVLAEFAKRR